MVAGGSNTTGHNNVFLGAGAGLAETGSNKLCIDNCLNGNTFIGFNSGAYHSTGAENTFLGTVAGYNHSAGERNVLWLFG